MLTDASPEIITVASALPVQGDADGDRVDHRWERVISSEPKVIDALTVRVGAPSVSEG